MHHLVRHQGIAEEPTHEDSPINHDVLHPPLHPITGEPGSAQSSSGNVNSAEPNQVNQPPYHLRRWTKDHPLDNIVGNPSRPVSTRKQLASDALCGSSGCQDSRRSTSKCTVFLENRLVLAVIKDSKEARNNNDRAEYIAMSGFVLKSCGCITSQDYGFDFNKFPFTFHKALPRKRISNFFFPRLGIRSLTPETLRRLQEERMSKQNAFVIRWQTNVPTHHIQEQIEQLYLTRQWLIIGKSNLLFNAQKEFKENPSFRDHGQLDNTNFSEHSLPQQVFPAIYRNNSGIQWKYDEKIGVILSQVDDQWFDLSADLLSKAI
ncbi:hypothetical protein Tco_0122639 [Tanacetum coccineum]